MPFFNHERNNQPNMQLLNLHHYASGAIFLIKKMLFTFVQKKIIETANENGMNLDLNHINFYLRAIWKRGMLHLQREVDASFFNIRNL